ncbi:Uncharacterised protein [Mycobacteroides abscessus subsp. abscessus]|nr:Uncharacterised protein [Mycobacteroides abscessus subsp. abscessus]
MPCANTRFLKTRNGISASSPILCSIQTNSAMPKAPTP